MLTPARHRPNRLALVAHILFVISSMGCQGGLNQRSNERLDRSTGMTLSTAESTMVFARTEGQYSRSARDYLYLGPVETNRQGTRDYYLWVGVATTLDRGYLAPNEEIPDALIIGMRGELMELKLIPWPEKTPNSDSMPLYRTAVDVHSQLAARVSKHQLELLSSETIESLQVGGPGNRTREYRLWQEEQSWDGFLQEAGANVR